jgi:voltage-gated potassium channel Kch
VLSVFQLTVVIGSVMYLVDGPENGFTSIPRSIYWAIVTMTTVGYGDISPKTKRGQTFASLVMILGYGIIAIPPVLSLLSWLSATRLPPRVVRTIWLKAILQKPNTANSVALN